MSVHTVAGNDEQDEFSELRRLAVHMVVTRTKSCGSSNVEGKYQAVDKPTSSILAVTSVG
jgi:hypothetical protein